MTCLFYQLRRFARSLGQRLPLAPSVMPCPLLRPLVARGARGMHSCERRNPGEECQGPARRHGLAQARRQFMTRSKTGMLLAILSGLCGIGSLTAVVPVLQASAQLSDRIAAVINTEVIMLSELDDAMSDEIIRLRARYDGEEFEAQLLQKQYQVLNRIIERKIQLQEAREKEITVTDDEVDKAWEQVQSNPEAYPPEFIRSRDVFREEMVLRRVAEFEVQRRILVPFEEIRDYYQEREQEFATPTEYHLYQIVLQPKPDESMEEVRERAETLERQLQAGASFEKLASIYSDGPTKDQGGDLEFVQKEDLMEPLRAALDALEPGERSPVIETDIGMHVLLLGEIRKGTPQPFDEVKDEVEKRLYQKKMRDAYSTWLSALKDKSYINILL